MIHVISLKLTCLELEVFAMPKCTPSEGTNTAVKVLNLQLEGAFRSFDAKCQGVVRVHHMNLVKVITSSSNPELRALFLQYLLNASLEILLYVFVRLLFESLSRVSITVDVALALEDLHHFQSDPICCIVI